VKSAASEYMLARGTNMYFSTAGYTAWAAMAVKALDAKF